MFKIRLGSGGPAEVEQMRIVLNPAKKPGDREGWEVSCGAEEVIEHLLFKVGRHGISQTISLSCMASYTAFSCQRL